MRHTWKWWPTDFTYFQNKPSMKISLEYPFLCCIFGHLIFVRQSRKCYCRLVPFKLTISVLSLYTSTVIENKQWNSVMAHRYHDSRFHELNSQNPFHVSCFQSQKAYFRVIYSHLCEQSIYSDYMKWIEPKLLIILMALLQLRHGHLCLLAGWGVALWEYPEQDDLVLLSHLTEY